MNKLRCLSVIGVCVLLSAKCLGLDPAAQKGLDDAMRSVEEHRLPPPEVMEDPVNREWVEMFRARALSGEAHPAVAILFLNLGDPEVMRKYLEIYPGKRWNLERTFAGTIQPKLIAGIAADFYRDEPSADTRQIDFSVFPASIAACYITQEIIKNTADFSTVLKQWATEIDPGMLNDGETARRRREEMRVWWTENKTLFEAERYAEVKPPSTWIPDSASTEAKKPTSISTQSAIPTSGGETSSAETTPKATPSSAVAEPPKSESAATLRWMIGVVLVLVIIGVGIMIRR